MNWGLPEGTSLLDVMQVLLPVGVVTYLLRQAPFSLKNTLKDSPIISLCGLMMPVGVMVVLVLYTLGGYSDAPGGLPAALIALAATAAIHAWRRDSGLSIVGGTVVYMVLVNLVF